MHVSRPDRRFAFRDKAVRRAYGLRGSRAPERGLIPGKQRWDGLILDAGSVVGTIVDVGV